jgi:hypothetical protein
VLAIGHTSALASILMRENIINVDLEKADVGPFLYFGWQWCSSSLRSLGCELVFKILTTLEDFISLVTWGFSFMQVRLIYGSETLVFVSCGH